MAGWLGGLDPDAFQQMAQSEARMPCHMHFGNGVDYFAAQAPGTPEYNAPQCVGRAIHWSNQLKQQRPGSNLLELPENHVVVFSWPQEFIAHHRRETVPRRAATATSSGPGQEGSAIGFECHECGAHAFSTPMGVNHHGTPGAVDHQADADHVALNPDEASVLPTRDSRADNSSGPREELSATASIEERIIRRLIAELQLLGYRPGYVVNDTLSLAAVNEAEVIAAIAEVDNPSIVFGPGRGRERVARSIVIIKGGGKECLGEQRFDESQFDAALQRVRDWIRQQEDVWTRSAP
jgi:hypothetical protein